MTPRRLRWGVASFLPLALGSAILAQETPPPTEGDAAAATAEAPADPSKKYAELRKSKNRATQALADRYDDLMGMQEWVDVSGKHKTKARYVAHDPELKWVKLATASGKEATVQLTQLHKSSQAKVRQIAALQKKLDGLSADQSGDAGITAGSAEGGEYGRGEQSERRMRGERGERAERGSRRGGTENENAEVPTIIDLNKWLTSYDIFRANFRMVTIENGKQELGWGELHQLWSLSRAEEEKRNLPPGQESTQEKLGREFVEQLHDATWEAPVVRVRASKAAPEGEVEFKLAPLPKPLRMRFLIDKRNTMDDWSKLPPGKPVKFLGRFESVTPRLIVMRVRLADRQDAMVVPDGVPNVQAAGAEAPASEPATSDNPLEGVIEER